MIEIILGFPPNYKLIKECFILSDDIIFAYSPNIYNPKNLTIDPIVIEHEKKHLEQQGDDPEKWWHRYLIDPSFRFCQELEAYQAQFKAIKKKFKDRNKVARFLNILASDLSSPNYGNMCSYQEALISIKNNVKFTI